MPLDPKIAALLKFMEAQGAPPLSSMTIEEVRAQTELMTRMNPAPRKQVASISDRAISTPHGPLGVRIYRPYGEGVFPLLLFFHGGGFITGSLNTHDPLCRELCAGARAVVVAVDYRLAPENRFPAAVDDSLFATRWVAEHASELEADSKRIAVAGDSAGGNLSAVIAMRIRDESGPRLCGQVLLYPVTDLADIDTPSRREMGPKNYFMGAEDMTWMTNQYIRNESDLANPWCSPRRATKFGGLPPALVITAEYDPLRDEGEMYAQSLAASGVAATATCYKGMTHAFLSFPGIDQTDEVVREVCAWLLNAYSAA
jgi:acetyl esterase